MARVEVLSEVTGTVWKIEKRTGSAVAADENILILESMKMEIPVVAPVAGTVELSISEGDAVTEGQLLAVVES